MTNLRKQRKMAADLLKCGVNRVYISDNPEVQKEIVPKITREDIRELINAGYVTTAPKRRAIDKRQIKGQSKNPMTQREKMMGRRKRKRQGPGSRKGKKYARFPKKERWIQTIRPIRAYLRDLRAEGTIDRKIYRRYYLLSKGGMFRNKGHLKSHLIMDGHLKEE